MNSFRFLLPAMALAALFLLVLWRVEGDTGGLPPRFISEMTERRDGYLPPPPGSLPCELNASEPDGAALFQQHCAFCHGEDGKAATFVARQPGMPDVGRLTHPTYPPARQREILREGQGAMPAFGSRLSQPQQDALLKHIFSLSVPSPPTPSA